MWGVSIDLSGCHTLTFAECVGDWGAELHLEGSMSSALSVRRLGMGTGRFGYRNKKAQLHFAMWLIWTTSQGANIRCQCTRPLLCDQDGVLFFKPSFLIYTQITSVYLGGISCTHWTRHTRAFTLASLSSSNKFECVCVFITLWMKKRFRFHRDWNPNDKQPNKTHIFLQQWHLTVEQFTHWDSWRLHVWGTLWRLAALDEAL